MGPRDVSLAGRMMSQRVYEGGSLCISLKMGSDGRSSTATLAFFALAILMAALGREPSPARPVFDDREPAVIPAPALVAPTYLADSR